MCVTGDLIPLCEQSFLFLLLLLRLLLVFSHRVGTALSSSLFCFPGFPGKQKIIIAVQAAGTANRQLGRPNNDKPPVATGRLISN